MTRQELTDAVAEVIGVQPRLEVKVDTIVRLADLYAATLARSHDDHLQLPGLRPGPER